MPERQLAVVCSARWLDGDLELESRTADRMVRCGVSAQFLERFHSIVHRGSSRDPNSAPDGAPSAAELEVECTEVGYAIGEFFEGFLPAAPVGADTTSGPPALTRFVVGACTPTAWSVPIELALVRSRLPTGGALLDRLVGDTAASVARSWPGPSSTDPLLQVDGPLRLVGSFVGSDDLFVRADRAFFEQAVADAIGQRTDVSVEGAITDGSFHGERGLAATIGGDPLTPTVLVLSGHGNPGSVTFSDGAVGAADLAQVLRGMDIRVVLLAVCSGAQAPVGGEPQLDTARTLIEAGVPVVVAMAAPIDGQLAAVFVDGFLGELLAGGTVDAAVREGRRRMDQPIALGGRRSSWALPRLVVAASDADRAGAGVRELSDGEVRLVPVPSLPPYAGISRVRNIGDAPPIAVGRSTEVDSIRTAVRAAGGTVDGGGRLRVLHGIFGARGVGKSFVAREVAAGFAAESEIDVVWWFRADDEESILDGYDLLHRRLGLPEPSRDDRLARADAVRAHLGSLPPLPNGGPRWLLVFDNVAGAAVGGVVDRWSPGGGPGGVLITINGDVDWNHGRSDLGPLEPAAAAELLAKLARAEVSDQIRQLADLLGRLPLAIVHLGGLMSEAPWTWTPEFAIGQLRARPAEALGGLGGSDRTVAGVVLVSLAELSPADRSLFATLCQLDVDAIPVSVVVSSASSTAMHRGPAELADALAAFRSLGLVEVDRLRGRLRIHRLTALVARHLVAGGHIPDPPVPARDGRTPELGSTVPGGAETGGSGRRRAADGRPDV